MSKGKEEKDEDCGNENGSGATLDQQKADGNHNEWERDRKKKRTDGYIRIDFPEIPGKQRETRVDCQ